MLVFQVCFLLPWFMPHSPVSYCLYCSLHSTPNSYMTKFPSLTPSEFWPQDWGSVTCLSWEPTCLSLHQTLSWWPAQITWASRSDFWIVPSPGTCVHTPVLVSPWGPGLVSYPRPFQFAPSLHSLISKYIFSFSNPCHHFSYAEVIRHIQK